MTGTSTGSARQLVLVVGGLLAALGIGVLIGYLTFSGGGTSDAEGDKDLACSALEQLPDESFATLTEDGIGPHVFRLNAIGSHATAAGDPGGPEGSEDSWYAVGMDLAQAANTLDDELGDEALERVRELCEGL